MHLQVVLTYSERQWVATVMDVTDPKCHVCHWAKAGHDKEALRLEADRARMDLVLEAA